MISMIACVQDDLGIGYEGELLWTFPEDMKWFTSLTKQVGVVVMGRKTYESIGGMLPGRENYVLSSTPIKGKSPHWVKSIDEILELSKHNDIMVIGGASLYEALLPHASFLYITRVVGHKRADSFFPYFGGGDTYEPGWLEAWHRNASTFPGEFLVFRNRAIQ